MAFDNTYRESIQQKHLYNVGFTSTAKGVTNEGFATKNPHQVIASQIPILDVAETYGPLVASGIAAGKVEEHIVKLTADPTVNNNKAWIAYETGCITSGHAARGAIRLDQLIRKAETQYKLRVFERNSGNTGPDYSKEILPSDVWCNWEYDASAGTLYFDIDPSTAGKLLPLWGTLYTYIGDTVADATAAGDVFKNVTDGVNTAVAAGVDDTLTFEGAGGVSIAIDSATDTVTFSGSVVVEHVHYDVDFVHNAGVWEYGTSFTSVPDDLAIFLNGVKNKSNDTEYYTSAVVGGVLKVTFAFTTHGADWVNGTFTS